MNIVGGTVLDEKDIHGMTFNGIAGDRMVRLYSGAHEECRRSMQEGAYGKGRVETRGGPEEGDRLDSGTSPERAARQSRHSH